MANPTSPHQGGNAQQWAITVGSMQRVYLRCESGGTFKVHFYKNSTADATHAEGFLDSGDDVEIPFTTPGTLNVYAMTGDPLVFFGFLENAYPEG